MIINGRKLFDMKPVNPMIDHKVKHNGVSHGLAEVGYDIRIKQDVWFGITSYNMKQNDLSVVTSFTPERQYNVLVDGITEGENFCLASSIEEFQMPDNLVGIVHDKSTWARKGLSVFNTVIEPGWKGFLTLELVYHGNGNLHIPAGSGIAQIIFHEIAENSSYSGKYQGQGDNPVKAIMEG